MRKLNEIEQRVIEWQKKFPCDRWWREKHNIAFMSQSHREVSFLDQLFEFYEDTLVNEFRNSEEDYNPNQGDFLIEKSGDSKSKIISAKEEFESEFKDLLNG